MMPVSFVSKMFSEVRSANAPMADSPANVSVLSSPNLSVTRSAVTPETATELLPSV